MNAAIATTAAISQGLALGLHGITLEGGVASFPPELSLRASIAFAYRLVTTLPGLPRAGRPISMTFLKTGFKPVIFGVWPFTQLNYAAEPRDGKSRN